MADDRVRVTKIGVHLVIVDDGVFVTKAGSYAEIVGEALMVTSSGAMAEIEGGEFRVTSSGVVAEILYVTPGGSVSTYQRKAMGGGTLARLPDEVVGYALDPGSSFWSIIMPEETINYCKNPSFESEDPTNITSHIYGFMVATIQYEGSEPWPSRGVYCVRLTPTAATLCTMYYAWPATMGEWTFACDVYGNIGQKYWLQITDAAGLVLSMNMFEITQYVWERNSVTVSALGTATLHARLIIPDTNDGSYIYTDGWQIENKGYATTYCDGNMIGPKDTPPVRSYFWHGDPNDSYSQRLISDPLAGRLRSFTEEANLLTTSIVGLGQPDPDIQEATLGSQQKTVHITSYDKPRDFTITGKIFGCDYARLLKMRQYLISLLRQDRTVDRDQFILRYRLTDENGDYWGVPLEIACVYQSGMGGNITNFHQESVGIQFRAATPQLTEEFNISQVLTRSSPNTNRGVLLRDRWGNWEMPGSIATVNPDALNQPAVTHVAWVPNPASLGRELVPVAGGVFTTLHGDVVTNLAYYNGTNWIQIGAATDPITALLQTKSPQHVYTSALFFGGYNNAGGFAYEMSDAGVVTAAPFNTNARIRVMLEDDAGNIWIGGDFTTDLGGGSSRNYICVYRPSTGLTYNVTTILANNGLNGPVYDMALTNDGYLWIAGTFTADADGNAMSRICKLDINNYQFSTTHAFEAISSDTFTAIPSIDVAPDGSIYAGIASPGPARPFSLRRWNGITWEYIGPYGAAPVSFTATPRVKFGPKGWGYTWNNDITPVFSDYDQNVPHIQPNWYTISNTNKFGPVDLIMNDDTTPSQGPGWPTDIAWHPDGSIVVGFVADGSVNPPAALDRFARPFMAKTTEINNQGSAYAYPTIRIYGPAALVGVFNRTTGAEVWFNHYDIQVFVEADETFFMDFSYSRLRMWTDRRGTITGGLYLGATTTAKFWLQPGINYIGLLFSDYYEPDTKAWIMWKNTHWSSDHVAI